MRFEGLRSLLWAIFLFLSLFHEQFNEFFLAYDSIVILIDFHKDILDNFLRAHRIIQKERNFLIRNHPWMINIKIRKRLLKMTLIKHILHLQTSHYKLSQINLTRTISINQSQQHRYLLLRYFRFRLEGCLKLRTWYNSITVMIEILEDIDELVFLLWG